MKNDEQKQDQPAPAMDVTPADAGSELGAVRIHHGVVMMIARHAALRVPGVVEMSGSFAEGLAHIIGKADRGVRVEMDEPGQSLRLELHVVLEYGVRIPDVAWQIQTDVRRVVMDMTGKNVTAVDVVVQEVKVPSNKNKEEDKQ